MNIELVKERLTSLGYELVEGDDVNITFLARKVEQYIKHFCNISEVPNCLEAVAVDMVTGEFLEVKKATGKLTSIQIEPIVKRITEGDTTVEYTASGNADDAFNAYVDKLINGHESDLIAHRKLRW